MVTKKKQGSVYVIVSLCVALIAAVLFAVLPSRSLPCANTISCVKDLSGVFDSTKVQGEFMGQTTSVPLTLMSEFGSSSNVLGVKANTKEKKILVNLTTQKLYAYEGNTLVYHFTISSGKFNPTPVGKFNIWIKLLATDMEGGDKDNNTYYNLPNVPYTMYFYNENVGKWTGYGIHGAYWPMPYGKPMTQGCVVLQVADAAKLYRWADLPTNIIIFGKAPV